MFVIFDLDGTLALNEHREHHIKKDPPDWDGFFNDCDKDEPNKAVIALLFYLSEHYEVEIEIWSGRSEKVRDKTLKWLERFGIREGEHFSTLLMRGSSDFRSDIELKNEWLIQTRMAGRFPTVAFDDRNSVVQFWRDAGVTCCQVAEGDF